MAKLVECLDKVSTAHGMEVSDEKTKLLTNNTSGINTEIKVKRKKLETLQNSTGNSSIDKAETSLD